MANEITDRVINTTNAGNFHVMGWNDLFPKRDTRHRISIKEAKWHRLQYDTNFEGVNFKSGSLFKFFETENFGWVVFHPASKTPEGWTPGRFLFRY